MITSDDHLMIAMAEVGVGLAYLPEPAVLARLKRGRLRLVLEPFAPRVPGLFLYFPSRTQVSPAFRAFVDTVREMRPRGSSYSS